MRSDLTRLDLGMRRRGAIGSALGMALYTLLIVALYPTFKNDTSLNALTEKNSTLTALFGASGSLTSVDGWLSANLYANFVPLVALLLTVGYGANAIAGQDEEGMLGLSATLPLSRADILRQKAQALLLLAAVVPVVCLLCVLAGPAFQLEPDWSALVGTTAAVTALAFDIGLVAVLVGAVTGSKGTAIGVASTIAAVSYLISSLAPAIQGIHRIRWLSPFYWAVGDNQLRDGLGWSSVALLVGLGAVLFVAAVRAFDHLDVH